MRFLVLGFMTLHFLVGCEGMQFSAITAPPVNKTAYLDAGQKRITLSHGVALAVECQKTQNDIFRGPCEELIVTSQDPEVVQVYMAYSKRLVQTFDQNSTKSWNEPASVFVVVGKSPGYVPIEIDSTSGKSLLDVDVVADSE